MNICGIIAEYNPFHNGHKLHIEESLKISGCSHVVVAMSGNFVQRGEPAIVNKWERCKMAILGGADLVIEIPTIFSTASAESFSHTAIKLLSDSGIVNFLSFGSECGDTEILLKCGKLLANEPPEFKKLLANELSKGISFPVARQKALEGILGENLDFIVSSNNILAIEYLKALEKLKSNITPVTVKRVGEGYNSKNINAAIASATAIRNAIKNNIPTTLKSHIPNSYIMENALNTGIAPVFLEDFSPAFNYLIRQKTPTQLSQILDINEGLENRILKSIPEHQEILDLLDHIKTKRYTYTALQRGILHILLNIEKHQFNTYKEAGYAPYIRVLGFKKESQHLLGQLMEKSKIPVITNMKKSMEVLPPHALKLLEQEIQLTNVYYSQLPNKKLRTLNNEYTMPMVIV